MNEVDDEIRLEAILAARQSSGLTVDSLEWLSRGLDRKALATLCGNASTLPQYIQSNVSPYLLRNFKAPSTEIR